MDEKERLKDHIEMLFINVPRSRAAYELQEELLANSIERYDDLTRGGMGAQEALQSVINSIGDVDELISALPPDDYSVLNRDWEYENRSRSAMIVTIAVGLYILAGVVFFVGVFFGEWLWEPATLVGLAAAGALCIPPTCMLVYNAQMRPKYKKREDTVVENFKEWNNDSKKLKSLRGALSSVIWTVCLVAYFLVSFFTGAWAITWILFIIAACLEAVVTLYFQLRKLG